MVLYHSQKVKWGCQVFCRIIKSNPEWNTSTPQQYYTMMAYQQYTDRMSIGCCQQWWDYFTNTNRNFLSRNLYESNIGISFGALPSSQAGNQILIWIWNLTNWQKIPDFLEVHNVIPYHPLLMAVKHEFSLSKTVPVHPYTSYTRLCPHVATY